MRLLLRYITNNNIDWERKKNAKECVAKEKNQELTSKMFLSESKNVIYNEDNVKNNDSTLNTKWHIPQTTNISLDGECRKQNENG